MRIIEELLLVRIDQTNVFSIKVHCSYANSVYTSLPISHFTFKWKFRAKIFNVLSWNQDNLFLQHKLSFGWSKFKSMFEEWKVANT